MLASELPSEVNLSHGNQGQQLIDLLTMCFGDNEINGVEIGARTCILTEAILRVLPNLRRLWTIDPWEYREGAHYEAGRDFQVGHDNAFSVAVGRLYNLISKGPQFLSARDRVAIMYMHSDEAVEWIPWRTMPIDFVWIDGDHSPDQVEKDVVSYREIVRPGGLIGGHDFGTSGPVKQVVESLFSLDQINLGIATCWWVYL